jgi:hypothetical protein
MAGRTGILIIESNHLATVHRWLGRWNPYLDVDLTPVVEPPVNDPRVQPNPFWDNRALRSVGRPSKASVELALD